MFDGKGFFIFGIIHCMATTVAHIADIKEKQGIVIRLSIAPGARSIVVKSYFLYKQVAEFSF